MSKTIVTKSGSKFFTNISSERTIGKLCKSVGAKYTKPYWEDMSPDMAYEMTEEETIDTANKLRTLLDKTESIFDLYKGSFVKYTKHEVFRGYIEEIIKDFEDSKGYECMG